MEIPTIKITLDEKLEYPEDQSYKITMEDPYGNYSVEYNSGCDLTIYEVIEKLVRPLLQVQGFAESNINEVLGTPRIEWYGE